MSHFLLFLLLTLAAEILGTIGGFGSSVFYVPLLQIFFDLQTVLALTGLLHIFSNTSKIFLFRRTIDWKLVLTMGISSLVFAVAGAYMTAHVETSLIKLVLGVFLVIVSLLFLFKNRFAVKPSTSASIVGGALAGFLAGFVGTGGAIRGLVLTSFQLEKSLFVGTSAAIDFAVDLSRTAVYLDHSFLSSNMYIYIPLLIICSFVGSYLGKVILVRISQESFQKFVLIIILVMGLVQLYTGLR